MPAKKNRNDDIAANVPHESGEGCLDCPHPDYCAGMGKCEIGAAKLAARSAATPYDGGRDAHADAGRGEASGLHGIRGASDDRAVSAPDGHGGLLRDVPGRVGATRGEASEVADSGSAASTHARLCGWCNLRRATLYFGDTLALSHGGYVENCCALCAAEMQLAYAQERAAAIPELEAEVERLRKELTPMDYDEARHDAGLI